MLKTVPKGTGVSFDVAVAQMVQRLCAEDPAFMEMTGKLSSDVQAVLNGKDRVAVLVVLADTLCLVVKTWEQEHGKAISDVEIGTMMGRFWQAARQADIETGVAPPERATSDNVKH